MPEIPDIEKSTVKVKTLIFWLAAIIFTGGGLIAAGAASWVGAQDHARGQDEKLTEIVEALKEEKQERMAQTEVNRQRDQQILTLIQQVQGIQKRMDDYRAFKWSTPMMMNYSEALKSKNPSIDPPDPQAIHDKMLPFTP